MYLQVDLFGEHQPVDKHGNPLKIGDKIKISKDDTLGATVIGCEVNLVVFDGYRTMSFDSSLLEKINND
jgi:hypothetical protein